MPYFVFHLEKIISMKQLLFVILIILPFSLFAQFERNNEGPVVFFGVEYGFQIPGADLKDRFGNSTGLGVKLVTVY